MSAAHYIAQATVAVGELSAARFQATRPQVPADRGRGSLRVRRAARVLAGVLVSAERDGVLDEVLDQLERMT